MRRSRALALVRAVSLLSLLAGACSLDRRELSGLPETGGSGENPSNGAQAGAPDAPSSGSSAGGTSSGLVDGCADLDTDGVADCKTTLVTNPSFDEDVNDWNATPDAELSWDAKNALKDLPSGSAKLKAVGTRAEASQCVPVQGRQLVIAYANAFVADEAELGQAQLEASFFETEDCSGERAGYYKTPPSTVSNAWTVIQAGGLSLDLTRSVSLALVGLKADGADELDVYFDNVMLKTKAL
jgi:hypothetical protein